MSSRKEALLLKKRKMMKRRSEKGEEIEESVAQQQEKKKKKKKNSTIADDDQDQDQELPPAGREASKRKEVQEENDIITQSWSEWGESLGLDRRVVRATRELGWQVPTLVQSAVIPVAQKGRDVMIQARTGSGKTACYAIPVLDRLLRLKLNAFGTAQGEKGNSGILAIILAPTRELVAQARRQLASLASYCLDELGISAMSGEDSTADAVSIEASRPEIIVATPAALAEACACASANSPLSKLGTTVLALVIDEADLVLSFGYDDDVRVILSKLGLQLEDNAINNYTPKQVFLLSATLNDQVQNLKKVALRRAATVRLKEDSGVFGGDRDDEAGLAQFFIPIKKQDKLLVVYVMLKLGLLEGRGILFVNNLDNCYRLKLFLDMFSIRCIILNAELPLASRLHAIESYNSGYYDLLVATDAAVTVMNGDDSDISDDDDSGGRKKRRTSSKNAKPADESFGVARGIDFQNVRWVLNVDFPSTPAIYIHRIGRTARAGARGTAVSLVAADDTIDTSRLAAVQADQPPVSLAALASGGACELVSALAGGDSQQENDGAGAVAPQPAHLAFDAIACEPFRYRVDDVQRGVTMAAIKEARAAELRREILNAQQLKGYFEEHPDELAVLTHDKARLHTHRHLLQQNVKHVPEYLVPPALRALGAQPIKSFKRTKKKRQRLSKTPPEQAIKRRTDNDPLLSFDASDLPFAEEPPTEDKEEPKQPEAPRIYSAGDIDLKTKLPTSNRGLWKMKHKKGKWATNPKTRKMKKYQRGDTIAFNKKK